MADTKKYLDYEGLKLYDEKIKKVLADTIDALDVTDTAVEHQFLTAVSEQDGKISVSRAALVADDIPNLTSSKITDLGTAALANVAEVAIGAEDEDEDALPTVAQVKAYADGLDEASDARLDKLEALHNTKEDGSFQTVAEEAADAVAAVVDSAPEAFDTLKEIAQWIEKEGEEGFDAAKRITDLETKTADLVVNEGDANTVANAIAKAVEDEATRIDGIVGTPDTGKTIQGEIDDLEAYVGNATEKNEDGDITKEGSGLTKRIEDLEQHNTDADIFVPITNDEIAALFTPKSTEETEETA